MYGMFEDCKSLTSLDISSFITNRMTTLSLRLVVAQALQHLTLVISILVK